MPLKSGKKNISRNIRELHQGKMFARNKRKFGKRKAHQIAVAAAMSASRKRR